jgi:hypothetical protein
MESWLFEEVLGELGFGLTGMITRQRVLPVRGD